MTARVDIFDLAALRLHSGEGRRFDVAVGVEPFELGAETYTVASPDGGDDLAVRLEFSRTTGEGYALHIVFSASLHGACMRCLGPLPAEGIRFDIEAREVSQPGFEPLEGEDEPDPHYVREELDSPYVSRDGKLDLAAWVRDALALAIPATLLCEPDCLGLCTVCGENLNTAGPDHHHEPEPDSRWAALSELKFEGQSEAKSDDPSELKLEGQS